jgi:hypothetical protein
MNPEPFTVRMNSAAPALAEFGLSPEIAGTAGAMVKATAFDAPAPVVTTVTLTLPGEAIRLADMDAVSCVALT